ncbi:hypothetical protein BN1708_009553 [Verticillium longisporum]|uniref:FAD/NAD(P)-binding domain-containing protein n=1 Tax=Verticillium longisporum TaxID=100787 RepID=A0A0G4KII2_VERLO|nr:Thioredoxin reductase gliT like protein [Verticillium longisporum]CRK00456.1 hypothetical protein BN1708_009553 [Verticillium longisporum]
MRPHDVLIIGGGPAGLSTATYLARQLRTAVLFDSGVYRNARAEHMHGVLGFDHAAPASLRSKARADLLARYETTTFVDGVVTRIDKTPQGLFRAVTGDGRTWHGRRVVLATGVTDIMAPIPGFDACWGRSVFHCLYCHGYESRGATTAGVLTGGLVAQAAMGVHIAWMAKQLADRVTIYAHGDEAMIRDLEAAIDKTPFVVDARRIARMEHGPGETEVTLYFEDGTSVTEGFLAHGPRTRVNGPFVEQLSLDLTDSGDIKTVNAFGETTCPGVYAAGDNMQMMKAVPLAAAAGVIAVAGLSGPLSSEPQVEIEVEQ